MAFYSSEQIVKAAIEAGEKKVNLPLTSTLILGFLAGTYISFGFLLYIRITADLPSHIWGTLTEFIGAALFQLGLILILVAGREIVTGNIIALTTARLSKRITTWDIVRNWSMITLSKFIVARFIAYVVGHVLGLTETGPYLSQTISV